MNSSVRGSDFSVAVEEMIEFRLLGSVELVVDGITIDLGPSKQRGIIAAMLAEPERPISTEALVDRVWDDPPDTVRHSVYTYMTRLRRILRTATAHSQETAAIGRTVGGYRLHVDPNRIDLFGFRRLLNRSRTMDADHPDRADLLTLALGMWRGEPLAGLDSDWALRFRESLRQLRHEALVEWADASLRLGQLKVVAAELRKALLESPLAEDLHQRLLTAYYLDNRGAEALSHYDRMRRRFAADLGVDPGPRLRELHELLLGKQDPNGVAVIPISTRRAEPIPPANAFRGRTVEITRMQRILAEPGAPAVLITGGPGIGKSALADRLAVLLDNRFPDGVLRVNLGGTTTPAAASDVLEQLLRQLEITDIPTDLAARSACYRAALSERRMLVVLDDAATDAQLTPLLQVGPQSATLITSRISLGPADFHRVVLNELSMSESIEVLEAVLGPDRVRAEEWAVSALTRCCSGIPLALRAVAARLTARPHWTIVEQLGRMSDEEQRLNEFTYGPYDIRRSLATTVNRLTPAATAVYHHLGTVLTPRELFTSVALPTGSDISALDELLAAHLISVVPSADTTHPRHYIMLEIHRLYAKQLATRAVIADPPEAILA